MTEQNDELMKTAQCAGLTAAEAEASRREHGANVIPPPPHRPWWRLALEKLTEPLTVILGVAAVVAIATGGWIEGCGILIALLLSAGIGFLSEYRAGRAFDILNRCEDDTPVKVRRDGAFLPLPRGEVVVGDLVNVEAGEEVPADAEVLEAVEFRVDQSKFTGEPEPVDKVPKGHPDFAELAAAATYPPDRLLRGSPVIGGRALLRITAVGAGTEFGGAIRAATELTDETTPLQRQLARLGKVIAIIGTALALLLFALLVGRHWLAGDLDTGKLLGFFMVAVTLIVVTVPEGLPMSVILSLACSMRRMAQSNCLIRKLHAAETIGCATVVCTDKTGTLTMNRMRVAAAFFDDADRGLADEAMAVNSSAELGGENGDTVLGNPTEGALLFRLADAGVDYRALRRSHEIRRQWSFSTETKYMATRLASGRLHLKGAPEIVLGKCGTFRRNGATLPLGDAERSEVLAALRAEQSKGNRTIAFAFRDDPDADPGRARDLTFLGFVSIADPLRPDAAEAIRACGRAGIRVKIVTGDTAATATEIGRQLSLDGGEVITGPEFEALSPEETAARVGAIGVIARARPLDKLKLVRTLQQQGEVVAVTGDGVNDAPALHHADVGVAMGRTGTAIAREAADVILLDDSFRTLVEAVLWGRSLYLNIQKFLVFQLTINLAAAAIALLGPFAGIELPFTVLQMFWINLIMDSLASLALSTEPPTPEVMSRPPRDPASFIITRAMAAEIAATALGFVVIFLAVMRYWRADGDLDPRRQTLLFTGFVLFQVWNLINIRGMGSSRSMILHPPANRVFTAIVFLIVALQAVITQCGGRLFRTVPLSLRDWLILAAVSASVLIIGELRRLAHRLAACKNA